MPVGTICSHSFCLPIGMLMGMVGVLIARCVQVLVLMPHLVMAMPVGMVFIEQQSNATDHQGTRCNQVGAEGFLEDQDRESYSNKWCRGKNHRFPGSAQLTQCQQVQPDGESITTDFHLTGGLRPHWPAMSQQLSQTPGRLIGLPWWSDSKPGS